MKKFLIISAIVLIISVTGFSLDYISIDAGFIFIGNAEPNSAPSPIIPTIGVSLPLFLGSSGFYYLPRILFYGTDYEYTGRTRPVPAEIENSEFYVAGAILQNQFGYRLVINNLFEMGFLAGLSFLVRIPIASEDAYAQQSGVYTDYFYGNMRFLYPDTEISVKWNVNEYIGLMASIQALWPLFHLWDNESLPFYDQLIVGGMIGVAVKL